MAIHAGKLASEAAAHFLQKKISRSAMEKQYQQAWNRHFAYRLFWGRRLHRFMGKPALSEFSVRALQKMPFLLPAIVRQTHGKEIVP
jgi:flavin-dependent dehydrogenase